MLKGLNDGYTGETMKYNKELLDRFLTEKVAIALRTQEEWNEFMDLLEKETSVKWRSGSKLTKFNHWGVYRENSCVVCEEGSFKFMGYASCEYCKKDGYEIIEFKELIKEREMNLADKLRFLADRWEDGKDFYMGSVRYSLNYGELVLLPSCIDGEIEINDLKGLNLKLAPQWTFTEDEKVILRNLSEEYKWIVRDKDGSVFVLKEKPQKGKAIWIGRGFYNPFKTIFQSIQWSDEEPCEFRKYL